MRKMKWNKEDLVPETIPEDYRQPVCVQGISSLLPPGHTLLKVYRAYEGDVRMITLDRQGIDHRWVIAETEQGRFWVEKP